VKGEKRQVNYHTPEEVSFLASNGKDSFPLSFYHMPRECTSLRVQLQAHSHSFPSLENLLKPYLSSTRLFPLWQTLFFFILNTTEIYKSNFLSFALRFSGQNL